MFNAPATNATTGAAATTVNSGDAINGGAGNDTLNIDVTATNNNSLSGLTATSIEAVNISGTNNLGASSPALAAAQDAKAITAAALTARQSEAALAIGNDAAADVVDVLASRGISGTTTVVSTGQGEFGVVTASTATVESAAARAAAATHFATLINTELAAYNASSGQTAANGLALATKINLLATSTTSSDFGTIPSTGATFTTADVRAIASAVRTSASGTSLTAAAVATGAGDQAKIDAGAALAARNSVVSAAIAEVNTLAQSTLTTDLVAGQEAAAATYVASLTGANIVASAALTGSALTTAFTALNRSDFTAAQLVTAAKNAAVSYTGAAVAEADQAARAAVLATAKGLVADVNVDFSIAQLNTAAVNATRDATGVTLLTAGDDSVAIDARAVARAAATETARGNALTAADTALAADVAAATAVTVALAGVGATTVSAAQFADATAITLSGSSSKANVTGVAATQTIGFSSVSSMDNAVTFGATVTAGALAVSASTGTLTVTGATMAALNISGTGSTALTLVDNGQAVSATGADTIKTLNLSTSGGTNVTTSSLTELTTVSQTGAGAVTATLGTKVASVTTGAGADLLSVSTTTAVDNAGTTLDETVNASVTSGAGADRLIIATTGSGKTSVDSGAGNDTIYLTANLSGSSTISTGADNDTIRAGTIASLQTTKIDGGVGTDTLVTSTTTFTGSDYTVLGANVAGVENLTLTGRVDALDASKAAFTTFTFLGKSTTLVNTITEVSTAQNVVMARTAAVTATTGYSATGISAANASHLSVSAKGYVADSDLTAAGKQTVWGEDLRVTLTNTEAATSLLANGNKVTVAVAALAQSGVDGATTGDVTGISTTATLTGDVRSADVTLTSVRGTGSVTAPYGLGTENLAGFSATVATNNLQNMTSVKVSGAGSVVIDAGTLAALPTTNVPENAKLTLIDLSGMTALADQNTLGQEIGTVATVANTVGGYNNLSTSTVTLNGNIAETVILGGAKDTVATSSTVLAMDTITGFQLTASATDPLVVDLNRSDALDIGSVAFSGVKMTTTATSLNAALLEAANLSVAGVAKNDVVFNFGGDTYIFRDLATGTNGSVAGLDDGDVLVKLSGNLNLDLLLQSGVIIV